MRPMTIQEAELAEAETARATRVMRARLVRAEAVVGWLLACDVGDPEEWPITRKIAGETGWQIDDVEAERLVEVYGVVNDALALAERTSNNAPDHERNERWDTRSSS